ncbi:MAG: trigger factor [Patescibacteria group bacterium]
MFTHKTKRLPKNTIEIEVIISKDAVAKEYKVAFIALQKELAVEGFRKGNVPEQIAEKHLKKETVYQRMMHDFLPKIYEEILKKEGYKPIVNPRIELMKAKDNEDWELKIILAEKPEIQLGDYKEKIKKVKGSKKSADIWVPGKESEGEDPKLQEQKKAQEQQQMLNSVLDELMKTVTIEFSEMIIEEELNNRLAKLLDDVQKIGMTMDAYLKSKNTTMEDLRASFTKDIENTYKIEFILNEIADKEEINVENEELEKIFGSITDEKEKATAQQNAYFYAMILRKQKVLDYLLGL